MVVGSKKGRRQRINPLSEYFYLFPFCPFVFFLFFHFSLLLRSPLPFLSLRYTLSLWRSPFDTGGRGEGGKHSQSFSPFCDSISADIAAVSLDSSIRSDEDAAEGDIFARDGEKEKASEIEKDEGNQRNRDGKLVRLV